VAGELKPPRVRPVIRRIAIWVTPVLLLIAAWQIWDAIEARRLDRAIAAIAGQPVPTKIVAGATDEGAGKYYAAAAVFAVSVKRGDSFQATPGGPLVDAAIAMRDALAGGTPPPKRALDEASRQIEESRPVFDLISKATAMPFERFAPGTDFNYRFSGLLDVHRLAGLETMHLVMDGQGDPAARTVIDRLASLRAFDEQNWLFEMTRARQVRDIATDIGILVSHATVSEDRLIDLDRTLSRTYANGDLERAIRAEVLWTYGTFRTFWERPSRAGLGFLYRPLLRHYLVNRAETTADALRAARLPWPDRIRAMEQIVERQSMLPTIVPYLGAPIAPQFRGTTITAAEGLAALRCARVVIAIERYRRLHKAAPAALNDVMTEGDEVKIDPFTGTSLRYARTDTSYVVYSIGRDGKDENGTFSSPLPAWQTKTTAPPIDIGVRVILK
jgi:hypothetical protein